MRTYDALVCGDRIEWIGESPEGLSAERGLSVKVSIQPLEAALPPDWRERQAKAFAALDSIAARGGIPDIPDPVAWQREIRKDRPLPGRE